MRPFLTQWHREWQGRGPGWKEAAGRGAFDPVTSDGFGSARVTDAQVGEDDEANREHAVAVPEQLRDPPLPHKPGHSVSCPAKRPELANARQGFRPGKEDSKRRAPDV